MITAHVIWDLILLLLPDFWLCRTSAAAWYATLGLLAPPDLSCRSIDFHLLHISLTAGHSQLAGWVSRTSSRLRRCWIVNSTASSISRARRRLRMTSPLRPRTASRSRVCSSLRRSGLTASWLSPARSAAMTARVLAAVVEESVGDFSADAEVGAEWGMAVRAASVAARSARQPPRWPRSRPRARWCWRRQR